MKYNDFQGIKLSALGFGCMRLPLLEDGKTIDEELTAKMFDTAIKGGVNYFDTAWPYHGGMSEIVTGKILKNYPRDSFYLASKFPGRMGVSAEESADPSLIFEKQLEKCGVDYFDFYLCHNINESNFDVFEGGSPSIIDYLIEQKKLGKIKHLGFSSHAKYENLKAFLERHPGVFEFCQIQLNYLDWTLQDADKKYALLTELGIPVWVMEGIRGGKLAVLPENLSTKLRVLRPEATDAEWAIRWVQNLPNVCVQLSGMTTMSQVEQNLETVSGGEPLSEAETEALAEVAEGLKNAVPCTKCRYCCDGCPAELDIPSLIASYNEFNVGGGPTAKMYIMSLPEDKRPTACLSCGQCVDICPQKINVPELFEQFSEKLGIK